MARHIAAKMVERWTGIHVMRTPPTGFALAQDIARFTPDLKVETVFDVGGNIGQSVEGFAEVFPAAAIHSFEPGDGIYDKLVANTRHLPRVRCHKLALGAAESEQTFVVRPEREVFSHLAKEGEDLTGRVTHTVHVSTLDGFCAREGIARINLLKIDTEGHDFDVLRGAEGMVRAGAIDFIKVETGLNPLNTAHVPLRAFQDWMEERGYFLFGFYDQVHEFRGEPQLRRCDVVFLSPRVRETHRRPKPVKGLVS